jgi:peptidoglycan/LPS O-acetylase OafA/YrhL
MSDRGTAEGSGRERILQLDVVRGLSIVLVVLAHTTVHPDLHSLLYFPLKVLNRVGFSGVDVFFVLSGFLVGGLLMKEYQRTGGITPSRFFVRRAFKVWPTFYAFLVAYGIAIVLKGHEGTIGDRTRDWFAHEWPNFFHIQNYVPRRHATIGLFWSLAVEEHFYLALPWVLIFVFGLRGTRLDRPRNIGFRMTATFVSIAIVCLALRWWTFTSLRPYLDKPGGIEGDEGAYRLFFPTHLRIDSLFCGVFLAYLVRFHGDLVERLRPARHVILAVSLLGWVPFYYGWSLREAEHGMPWGMAVLYLSAAGLVIYAHLGATAKGKSDHGVLRIPMLVLAWLGVRSYSIYVWHGYFARPVGVRVTRLLGLSGDVPGLEGWASDLIMIASNALVGAIGYELIELPGLRLRQRIAPDVRPDPVSLPQPIAAVEAPGESGIPQSPN